MLSLPSTSSSLSRRKHDVFLSFRGEDTRKKFTDHLYAALERNGIFTFRDDQKLEAGEEITPELRKAIQESWCSLIIFSKTYAFSGWCLEELAEIVEQRKKRGHKIFPIFYDVDPSDLRKQTEKFEEAFAKHKERYKEDKDKIKKWQTALTEAATIKGWHLSNRHESEFIGDIVKSISTKLCQTYSGVPDELIGINSRLEELHSKIDIGEDDVRIIGICGMGGIGKTTLARVVYTQMSPHFEGKCFLADVREISEKCGIVSLQKQLLSQILLEESFNLFNVHEGNVMISHKLSHKKVLIVIDDADNMQHLKCLIGRRDWFGLGSRIIVTTRDEHLLRSYKVDDVYKPTTLNVKEALQLFNWKAFKSDTMLENDFIELSKLVVEYADGLPLALEVLGSFLCGRDVTQWRSAIERLKRDSNKEIHDRLQISFDGLEETEKNIFLDIACFFNKEEKGFVTKVLDGCKVFPDIGIDVLITKSLVSIDEDNKLRMHDLLQEMGRKIVRQKSLDEPGKRCRLWENFDVYHVMTNNTATEAIEGMVIDNKREQNMIFTLNVKAFLKMKKLRLLKVFSLPCSHDLKYLSNELRLLQWHGYPFKSLPSNCQLDNLVALLLPYSYIEKLWNGNRPLYKLKLVNLKGSQNLMKTPNFEMVPNLESLIFEGCTRIVDFHPSIGVLKKLKLLNLRGCKCLRSLPPKIAMKSLEELILSDCSNLERFPKIDGEMECFLKLYLDGTRIKDLPFSIGNLRNLVLLNLKDCSNLVTLPSSINGCKCLRTLNLCGCSKLETLPENLQQLEFLEELDLSETAIREPTSFIFKFKNLKVLSFRGCKGSPSKLQSDRLSLFKVMQRGSMDSLALMLPPLSGLSSLRTLNLSDCNLWEGALPSDICCLASLETLTLSGNNFRSLPTTLTVLPKLCFLDLSECKSLKSLPDLPTKIESVNLDGCASLEVIANPSTMRSSFNWPRISAINCYQLVENNNTLTMLKKYIKVFSNARGLSDIVLPGSEIPEWFSHQSEWDGSLIKIPLPLNIRNNSQWMGVALCCIFGSTFNDVDARGQKEEIFGWKIDIHGTNSRKLDRNAILFGRKYRQHIFKKDNDAWWHELDDIMGETVIHGNSPLINCSGYELGRKCRRQQVKRAHLWIRFMPRDLLYPSYLGDKYSETECDEISISSVQHNSPLKLKKCGVRIVYEKDLEETKGLQA